MPDTDQTLDHPAASLAGDASHVELLVDDDMKALDPQDAIDLGTALIALGKHAVVATASAWDAPAGQRRLLTVSWRGGPDHQLNYAGLVAALARVGSDWQEAWRLGREIIDSDHGSVVLGPDWTAIAGRSRRLELALQMLSWAAADPDHLHALEAEVAYLHSPELRDRLLSL